MAHREAIVQSLDRAPPPNELRAVEISRLLHLQDGAGAPASSSASLSQGGESVRLQQQQLHTGDAGAPPPTANPGNPPSPAAQQPEPLSVNDFMRQRGDMVRQHSGELHLAGSARESAPQPFLSILSIAALYAAGVFVGTLVLLLLTRPAFIYVDDGEQAEAGVRRMSLPRAAALSGIVALCVLAAALALPYYLGRPL